MLDKKQRLQSDEYAFPYHYLPVSANNPRLTRHWAFAPSYLAALSLVRDWLLLQEADPETQAWKHIDIGCGDGALLFHLSEALKDVKNVELYGIDYDEQALRWARIFNHRAKILEQEVKDLEPNVYDSASLVEVAEHIPPDSLPCFLDDVANALRKNGHLLVTVPSVEKPLQAKHYQHFSFNSLQDYASDRFEVIAISGFEQHTALSKLLHLLMYRTSMRIETPASARVMVRALGRLHSLQNRCGRIFAVLRKK